MEERETRTVRIVIPGSSSHEAFAAGTLTQLEWVEQCASRLGADGVLPALGDFPRTDTEYVAQLRKVCIDLGVVPFGIEVPGLLDPSTPDDAREAAFTLASAFGALVIRTQLPAPGEVPPAAFNQAVGLAKTTARAAKGVNVTLVVAAAAGTLGPDLAAVRHLAKDVDSAWLRPLPYADELALLGAKDRAPASRARAGEPLPNLHGWAIVEG